MMLHTKLFTVQSLQVLFFIKKTDVLENMMELIIIIDNIL